MPQIISFGEALIDMFAEPGIPLGEMPPLYPAPGGAPANVAVGLARLGAEVGFIGKVGTDQFGTMLIDLLANEGVSTTYFLADPQAPTMLAVIATPSPTEQNFALYNGASSLFTPEELPYNYIASAKTFIYGSVTLAGGSRDALRRALAWGKVAGQHLIFDVNLRPALWPDLELARQRIEACLDLTTILKVNEVELEFLTGLTDPTQGCQQLLERGIQLCCVSLGGDGAYFSNGQVSGHVPVFSVDIANTTGSGDAFVSGLAFQLSQQTQPILNLDEFTLRDIVTFANACGALAATQVGAMSALPTYEAVIQFLQNA